MTIKRTREILRTEFGTRMYRITGAGEIHVFGVMPNTTQEGWYLFGWVGDPYTDRLLEDLTR